MRSTDTLTDNSVRLLTTLASAPFAERDELAAFAGLPRSSTLESLRRMEERGLVAFVRHTRSNTSRVRRWYLTAWGVERLAALRGTAAGRLLRELPISAQWQRSLLRRLDAVASLYQVGREVAACSDCSIDWRWQRTGALDALMELPEEGATLALARFGPTLSWQAMRSRIGTLYGMQRAGRCPTVLLLLPGNVETQRLAADLRGRPLRLFAAVEDDVMHSAPGSAVWRSLRDTQGLTLAQFVGKSRDIHGGRVRVAAGSGREGMPASAPGGTDGLDLLSTELTMGARRLLDALYDWPLMTSVHLQVLVDMSESPMKKARASLVKKGLVCQLRIGSTPEGRQRNATRLCLGKDGLRYLARRDRSRLSDLIGRWGIIPDATGDERLAVSGFRLEGSRLRVLARELRHTDGVSDFVAEIAAACRRDGDWLLHQALPPHRWERWFRHKGGWRSIRPDAVIELGHRGSRLAFLLEYEERARNPAPMAEKLTRYRRYFESRHTERDFFGGRATALFVFADDAAASRFCVLAAGSLRHPLPLLVSSTETIANMGTLGPAWRSPWQLELGHMPLAAGL